MASAFDVSVETWSFTSNVWWVVPTIFMKTHLLELL